jgi:site-specific recombinase XerD
MLDPLFMCPWAVRRLRSGPFGPWLDSFTDRLCGLGYTPWTCRSYVVLAADLGRWVARQKIPARALEESVVDAYIEHRKTQGDRRRAASLHFLDHLRAEGTVPARPYVADHSPVGLHCGRFEEHLRKERGACDGTVEGYVAVVRDFLSRCFGTDPVELTTLEGGDIGSYLLDQSRTRSPKRVEYLATVLRSFFRFLFARGETPSDLSRAVLTARTTRFASVPRYLPDADVQKLLDACDPDTPGGRRDHAILLLLARLGLRGGEVAALELDDIRWRSGEIVVRGKGNVVDRLPLLPEVGKALALYVAKDRPKISSRRLFLRLCAPIQGLAGREAISSVVRSALERAGLHPPIRGAHLLRHSLGTRMIRAGASMAEIGEVLRHHSPGTTEIYAKVDFEALRALAQAWPGAGGGR